jgi:Poly(ADP-ribose) polymerase and DNA-Ligase Zn-finger region
MSRAVVDLTMEDDEPVSNQQRGSAVDFDRQLAEEMQRQEYGDAAGAAGEGANTMVADFTQLSKLLKKALKKTTKSSGAGEGGSPRSMKRPYYEIQVSKSNRAKCGLCEEKIDKGVVRVSVQNSNTQYPSSQHLKCTFFHKSITSGEELDGYNLLNNDQKAEVCVQLVASASKEEEAPVNPDDLVRQQWDQPIDPPDTLLMPLLPFQKEGLGWMVHQETESNYRGGILADEM